MLAVHSNGTRILPFAMACRSFLHPGPLKENASTSLSRFWAKPYFASSSSNTSIDARLEATRPCDTSAISVGINAMPVLGSSNCSGQSYHLDSIIGELRHGQLNPIVIVRYRRSKSKISWPPEVPAHRYVANFMTRPVPQELEQNWPLQTGHP